MDTRLTLAAVAAAATLFLATEARAQDGGRIEDEPNSANCTENCIDAGYEWAVANRPVEDEDCAAANEDFAAGCAHWLEEQREASAPRPEEPEEPLLDDGPQMSEGNMDYAEPPMEDEPPPPSNY